MRTSDLIAMLVSGVEPVTRGRVERAIAAAVVVAASTALATMLVLFGVRADLDHAGAWTFLGLKLAATLTTVLIASLYLIDLARPTGAHRARIARAALPFAVVMALAAMSLAAAPTEHWHRMIVGDEWLECLLSIPIIAVVPFTAIVWTMRRMAPTDLRRAGALTGLVAGGISAIGYALHCTDDSLPFIALWYGGAVVLCAAVGAILGPRLLRW